MKKIIIICALVLSCSPLAARHSLGAHEHGIIRLGIAIDKNVADIDLEGPAESFLGFEHLPKTASELKIFNDAKNLWERKVTDLISFDKKLDCKISEATFKQIIEKQKAKKEQGIHSEIEASAKITCFGSITGTSASTSLLKHFKNIKKLTLEILGDDAKRIEITRSIEFFKI